MKQRISARYSAYVVSMFVALSGVPLQANQNETTNIVCGKNDDQDTYYSEVALNESDGIATFVRRSRGRTIGPDRLDAIFTPTEVQFEKVTDFRTGTKEVFRISRIDLTMTRWLEASFSRSEPRKSVLQCAIAPAPAERAF